MRKFRDCITIYGFANEFTIKNWIVGDTIPSGSKVFQSRINDQYYIVSGRFRTVRKALF